MLWIDWKRLCLQLCPGRSWRALSPAVSWATSSCPSPETIRTERTGRADTSRTTWSSRAATSPTSCSSRRGASMSAGETDAGGSAAASIICCYRCLKRVPLSTRNTRYVLDERNPLPPFVPAHSWWFTPHHRFRKLRLYFVHSEQQNFSLLFCSLLPLRGKCSYQADYPFTGPSTRLFILPWLTLMFRFLEWLKENKTHHAGRISTLFRL